MDDASARRLQLMQEVDASELFQSLRIASLPLNVLARNIELDAKLAGEEPSLGDISASIVGSPAVWLRL